MVTRSKILKQYNLDRMQNVDSRYHQLQGAARWQQLRKRICRIMNRDLLVKFNTQQSSQCFERKARGRDEAMRVSWCAVCYGAVGVQSLRGARCVP